jgi:hypothetical protein
MRTVSIKAGLVVWAAALTAGMAHGASFSFTGSFTQDDQVQVFRVQLSAPGAVTARSFGYAGGNNQAGNWVPGGGFDTLLNLFAGIGPGALLFDTNDDGGCPAVGADSATGACWDSVLTLPLPAGEYTLVLSQSPNSANGPLLGDGFAQNGNPAFTGTMFLGSPGQFIDANPSQRDGHWAIDILDVDSASVLAIPEPATIALATSGLGLLVLLRRRRKLETRKSVLAAG